MRIAGIDYSLCSPSVTVIDTDGPSKTAVGHYLTDTKRNIRTIDLGWYHIRGTGHRAYACAEERHDQISDWAVSLVRGCGIVWIEDYAMGAKGKVFHLGENAGLLKWKLWREGIPFALIAPTALKKFATGKGNADKQVMHSAFFDRTGIDLSERFGGKIANPVSDLVDSMWLAWMAEEKSPPA